MKNLALLIVSCALLMASCAKESSLKAPEGHTGKVVFEITTHDAHATRGGSIYGAEAQSAVAAVTIYAFKETATAGEFAYDATSTAAITLDQAWTKGDTSGKATIVDAALDGNFQFVAVGTEEGSPFTVNPTGLNFDTFIARLTSLNPLMATPIYSGSADAALTEGEYHHVTITIKRAVAGIMLYLHNIPTEVNDKTPASLRLTTTTNLNNGVNLSTLEGVAPATANTDRKDLINIPLINPDEDAGIFGSNELPDGILSLPNSQLGGTYVIPTDAVNLTLGLYDADGILITSWPITVPDGGNLDPNVLYALGTKKLSTTTTGTDGPGQSDPTDDTQIDDDALDIMKDQLILVEVEDAWDSIKDLELGEQTNN